MSLLSIYLKPKHAEIPKVRELIVRLLEKEVRSKREKRKRAKA